MGFGLFLCDSNPNHLVRISPVTLVSAAPGPPTTQPLSLIVGSQADAQSASACVCGCLGCGNLAWKGPCQAEGWGVGGELHEWLR